MLYKGENKLNLKRLFIKIVENKIIKILKSHKINWKTKAKTQQINIIICCTNLKSSQKYIKFKIIFLTNLKIFKGANGWMFNQKIKPNIWFKTKKWLNKIWIATFPSRISKNIWIKK
jgi:hypothetical protein